MESLASSRVTETTLARPVGLELVASEIPDTMLIATAQRAALGQLKTGGPTALLGQERRIGGLVASIHQLEREIMSRSAETASLEVALKASGRGLHSALKIQEAMVDLRRLDQEFKGENRCCWAQKPGRKRRFYRLWVQILGFAGHETPGRS